MSGHIMTFPNSVDEFMESYKMVDTEHIYSNGTEYVPIFRMKQWFEHKTIHGKNICDSVTGHCEFKCSLCGADASSIMMGSLDGGKFNYCPNCGARMDESEEDDEQIH